MFAYEVASGKVWRWKTTDSGLTRTEITDDKEKIEALLHLVEEVKDDPSVSALTDAVEDLRDEVRALHVTINEIIL